MKGFLTLFVEEFNHGSLNRTRIGRDTSIFQLDRHVDVSQLRQPSQFLVCLELGEGAIVGGLNSARWPERRFS